VDDRPAERQALQFVPTPEVEHEINRRLFETSIDLILVTDGMGRLIRVSPSVRSILGRDPADMTGRIAREFVYPDDLDSTRLEMRLARRGHLMRNFDCRYMHTDGHPVALSWTGVWSEEARQHFFIGRDMTERLAAEKKLRHLQRMDSVGQLTGGIAHDFNNLLMIVMGSIDLLCEQPELTAASRKLVEDALYAAQRGAELTGRLLAFSRQQPLNPKRVDIGALLRNFVSLLGRTVGENIELAFSAAPGVWPVTVDPASLETAIANLTVNARDAMPDGGRLFIGIENAVLDAVYAQSNPGAEAGEYVAIVVADTGVGMAAEVADRIFEPFFTTKEPGRGTGLGLSMVFGFVKQSGGHIKVYSEAGHGTSFRIYLPRAAAAQPAETHEEAQVEAPEALRRRCILVVEDNDAIRAVVRMQLAKLGYRTIEAANGPAALALLEAGQPVDLLFTDIVMPGGLGGHDLARAALALRPKLRVLFTSGFPGALFAGAGRPTEAQVLGKPYRLQELERKVREVLQ